MPRSKKKHHLPEADTAPEPTLKLTVRLFHGQEIAMGPGKAELLEAIMETGSISAACKAMDMSYRRAWSLVDEMNRCFKERIVVTSKGGAHGGGAEVTPYGREVLKRYREMMLATQQVAQAYMGRCKDSFVNE